MTITHISGPAFGNYCSLVHYHIDPNISDIPGSYTFTLSLSDGINSPVTYSFTVNILPKSGPPSFSSALTD